MKKIPVGISSCLLGEPVRFDGGHKRDAFITGTLAQYFDFKSFCPEVAIGLGAPRPTLHLANRDGNIRCVGVKQENLDVTEALRDYALSLHDRLAPLCGYIFKKGSPSCGMARVKIYTGLHPLPEGVGIYAQAILQHQPLLPVEEEGRLGNPVLRENFIQRVYVLHRWKQFIEEGLTINGLSRFHARHKLIIMSHGNYQPLGQLVASATKENLPEVAAQYILALMTVLKKIASRAQHVNVLQHIQGYLKKQLTADDKAELAEIIEHYRAGEVPLIVPLTLLKHHFRKTPDLYIGEAYYMLPYPQALETFDKSQ